MISLTMGCSWKQIKPNSVSFNVGYGKDTCLGNISKTDTGESYSISNFSVEFFKDYEKWTNSLEFIITDHKYIYSEKYKLCHANSYTTKLWLIRKFPVKYFGVYVGGGLGFGYINPTKCNKYIANSNLISDIGVRLGMQKDFKNFGINLEYQFRHFSAIWKDDSGSNLDEIRVGLVFPF